jgi:hypothetical protein
MRRQDMLKHRMIAVGLAALVTVSACGGSSGVTEQGNDSSTTGQPAGTDGQQVTTTPSDLTEVPDTISPVGTENPERDPGDDLAALPDPKVPRQLEALVEQARADLAALLAVPEMDITVAVAESIVWPSGALGCPLPDMAYTDVQVDGWRTVLVHGADTYTYHGGGVDPTPFLCKSPNFP